MDPSERIDQHIAELADWRGNLVAHLRSLVLEAEPEMAEEWKWGTLVWSHRGLVCSVGIFKQAVKMNFSRGPLWMIPSASSMQRLRAQQARAIDFHEGDAVDELALKALIRAAVAQNGG